MISRGRRKQEILSYRCGIGFNLLNYHRHSELADGHTKRGGFVPPVQLPRRMFAGAQLTFLVIGEQARRLSTIRDLTPKKGRTGDLVFLRIHNEIVGPRGPAIIEDQDIVYREAPKPGADRERAAPAQTRPAADWSREVQADEALLFRYSALSSTLTVFTTIVPNLAAQTVARAEPDGYTLLLAYSGSHVANPALFPNLSWDPVKSFSPLALAVTAPHVIS